MFTLRPVIGLLLLLTSVACSADPQPAPPPPTKADVVGTAPQPTPEKLYSELVTRLAKLDGPGVCALFTKSGSVAFEDEWTTEPCAVVPAKVMEKVKDVPAFTAATAPKAVTKDSETVVELTGCGVGAMKALKSDKGWLIDAYLNPAQVPDCAQPPVG